MGITQNVRPRIGWSSIRSISSSAISNRIQFFNVADMKMWATTLMIKDQSLFPWYDPHKKLKENWAVGRVSHPTAQLPAARLVFRVHPSPVSSGCRSGSLGLEPPDQQRFLATTCSIVLHRNAFALPIQNTIWLNNLPACKTSEQTWTKNLQWCGKANNKPSRNRGVWNWIYHMIPISSPAPCLRLGAPSRLGILGSRDGPLRRFPGTGALARLFGCHGQGARIDRQPWRPKRWCFYQSDNVWKKRNSILCIQLYTYMRTCVCVYIYVCVCPHGLVISFSADSLRWQMLAQNRWSMVFTWNISKEV